MIITTIYRIGPSLKRKLKLLNPGATLAALFSILSSLAFGVLSFPLHFLLPFWFINLSVSETKKK
jgi:uncharacterized BrkB/YihY/UPF0761 family membrane protein